MNNALKNIGNTIGKKVDDVHVILHVSKDELHWDDTELQFTFDDGSVILLAGDGNDNIKVSISAWIDPFQGKLSPENKAFIQECGKAELINVSKTQPFNLLIGETIQVILPIFGPFNMLNGMQFQIGKQFLNFINIGDESHILWGAKNSTLSHWNCRVDEKQNRVFL